MPQDNTSLISGAVAGAIAGALVTVALLQGPLVGKISSPEQPQSNESILSADTSGHEKAVIETVKAAQPAVVTIVITQDVPIVEEFFQDVPGFGPFGNFFQFRVPQLRERGTEKREVGGGSGFLVSVDGLIVTNRHVVNQENAQYTVFTSDGTKYNADIVARDPVNDIAILKINGSNLAYLEFDDSDKLQVGQSVVAIGNALNEFRNTVSAGIISGLSRSIQAGNGRGQPEQLDEVIQTDAAINPGNSGGPLLNLQSKVVGVNVAMAQGSENIGFALPANLVKSIVDSVREHGKIVHPYLGVRYTPITGAVQEANKLSVDYGVLLIGGEAPDQQAVIPGSPAAKADLKEGDIILELDGQRLAEDVSLSELIRDKKVGDAVRLKVLRDGQERDVNVTLEEFPQ